MRRFILALSVILFAGQMVLAEELVPATSDDLKEFDRQVSQSKSAEVSGKPDDIQKSAEHRQDGDHLKKEKKAKKENFGALVSAEAKKLKDESSDKRKEMGQWVSDQRKKSGSNQAGNSEQHGGSRDSQDSSPANSEHGGSGSSGHGNSGDHKK